MIVTQFSTENGDFNDLIRPGAISFKYGSCHSYVFDALKSNIVDGKPLFTLSASTCRNRSFTLTLSLSPFLLFVLFLLLLKNKILLLIYLYIQCLLIRIQIWCRSLQTNWISNVTWIQFQQIEEKKNKTLH